jgi:hypothetical protein
MPTPVLTCEVMARTQRHLCVAGCLRALLQHLLMANTVCQGMDGAAAAAAVIQS